MKKFSNSRMPVFALAMLLAVSAGCGKDNDSPTAPLGDTTAPTVSSTNPINGATGVAVITATFSEAMTASSITTATFTVTGPGGTAVPGTVVYYPATNIARFLPTSLLGAGTAYTATITVGVKDASGNAMANNLVWGFTTTAAGAPQLAPVLAAASTFVVLAGSTVTNTGATTLAGDVGVSPGTAMTGFPPGTYAGAKHAGDVTSAAAMAALNLAYADAAGRTLAPISVAGNIGGLTLPAGLYKSTSSLAISSGDLTLDAQGDANAVFIFQIASTLTTTTSRAVILAGSARAANVFWQVGTSATLGATSVFKGTIMADQSISLGTGAALNGRALARIGAVTLAGNAVVFPTP